MFSSKNVKNQHPQLSHIQNFSALQPFTYYIYNPNIIFSLDYLAR
jgi:hypothetical protein